MRKLNRYGRDNPRLQQWFSLITRIEADVETSRPTRWYSSSIYRHEVAIAVEPAIEECSFPAFSVVALNHNSISGTESHVGRNFRRSSIELFGRSATAKGRHGAQVNVRSSCPRRRPCHPAIDREVPRRHHWV